MLGFPGVKEEGIFLITILNLHKIVLVKIIVSLKKRNLDLKFSIKFWVLSYGGCWNKVGRQGAQSFSGMEWSGVRSSLLNPATPSLWEMLLLGGEVSDVASKSQVNHSLALQLLPNKGFGTIVCHMKLQQF